MSFVPSGSALSAGGHMTSTTLEPIRQRSPIRSARYPDCAPAIARGTAPCHRTASAATPGTPTQPTATVPASPPTPPVWSSCAWVSTSTSTRRTPARASARRIDSSSAPASTSIVRPLSRTRIASPCPTSSATISHRCAGAGPSASTMLETSTTARTRLAAPAVAGTGHAIHAAAAPASGSATSSHPPSTATAAPGRRAIACAICAARPMTAAPARTATSPAALHTLPTTDPVSPSQSPAATSGDAYALARGAISETMPNAAATTGAVASWATSVSASMPATAEAGPRRPWVNQFAASPPKTSSAPTASTDSWSPMSKTDHGSSAITTVTAAASEAVASPRRLPSVASPPTTSITRDRSAEYGIPVVTAYAAPAAITVMTSAVLGSRAARPSAATAPQARAR